MTFDREAFIAHGRASIEREFEPVAWMWIDINGDYQFFKFAPENPDGCVPLYASPQALAAAIALASPTPA